MNAEQPKVVVVDLGLGNLRSVARAFATAGAEVEVSAAPAVMRQADALVVPGQGSFAAGARAVQGEMGAVLRAWIAADKPYFGICLGMQLLFAGSEEAPGQAGLGVFGGSVRALGATGPDEERLKVPHMGWNRVEGSHPLLGEAHWYYFVHSFYCAPEDDALVAGVVDYGQRLCAAVAHSRLFACQFHPEKSHDVGARLIQRYLRQLAPHAEETPCK
ncbi:MAG: imidazole glycerol phosphate synthase subunit HisH [Polyangiales bacterium]